MCIFYELIFLNIDYFKIKQSLLFLRKMPLKEKNKSLFFHNPNKGYLL